MNRRLMRRVLVVVDEPCTCPKGCPGVWLDGSDQSTDVLVVAPVHKSAGAKWLINDETAHEEAVARVRTCVAHLEREGIAASGRLADHDPVQAIADALDDFHANEIFICAAPQRRSTWLRRNPIDRARRRFRQPIEHVVVRRWASEIADELVGREEVSDGDPSSRYAT